ncbi:subunit of the dynactin complex, putative [Candida dubliniensis CD36]|uniref:Subunit of the dynactin complex, putative n=1 Tax=Candida dubliniensis (strain CD36 / ATCC MYA-646 / CBS 7987 / NCPF 3949 / NRRL Y-17841) TaxID=573826 RepID=B9WI31_CANDC|nr:subunit of the dynactin complex, putative [Candida dubliniensis CD36]CAX41828.1 subunit of the dynactin complex, putative [Candida dubliniensis CD36]
MNKYSDLPDIDNEGQEVFESSDVESEIELPIETTNDPDVEVSSINVDQSKELFARNEIVDTTGFDFSGNLSRLNGYSVTQVEETTEEKLSRISRELEEIKLQDHHTVSQQPDQLLTILSELKSENTIIKPLRSEQLKIDSLFKHIESDTPVASKSFDRLIDLENRLSKLESVVGTEDTTTSVQLTINDLSRKISIVENPEYDFDKIRNEVGKLTKELEELDLKRKVLDLDDDSTKTITKQDKIDELYEKLPNINKYNQVAPMLLTRLKTLNSIHQEMKNNIDLSNGIDQILNDVQLDLKNWDQTITKLNERINDYEDNFEKNSKTVQERISDLILKVDSLSTD